MRLSSKAVIGFLTTFVVLLLLHGRLLRLPYFWDEAGYYIPAALDFYHWWLLIPKTTLPVGHTPLVMIYLGLVWRVCGYSIWATRAAMTLIAAATVASLYGLARRVASREIALWSALLLALSPLFFAQTTLVHLDLTAALFTTLAVSFLLTENLWLFALWSSMAVLSKETAVVTLPVAGLFVWWKTRRSGAQPLRFSIWAPLVVPLVPLAAWTVYYRYITGYWTGNREYLSYNLYSTLLPARIFWSLLRRAYELSMGGFNWLLIGGALAGLWWGRKASARKSNLETRKSSSVADPQPPVANFDFRVSNPRSDVPPWRSFVFLTAGLIAIYLLLLSVVGGAILPRYLLPVMPLFYLLTVAWVTRLPRVPARLILAVVAACFVWSWFINPPYPFPFEDNLAYADFIRLHQQAARFLEAQPGRPRILTAWPATDELAEPVLGYVREPLRVAPVQGFAPQEFASVPPESFDLLYLYSRRWEPSGNWLTRFPSLLRLQGQYFDYRPQVPVQDLADRYHLRLLSEMNRRGQWVRIYRRISQ